MSCNENCCCGECVNYQKPKPKEDKPASLCVSSSDLWEEVILFILKSQKGNIEKIR